MTTRICVIRHGETDWNVQRRIQGHIDIPLNQTGRAQAMATAFNAAHHAFSAIYSSDLSRTMETAKAVAERLHLEVRPLILLRERHYGIFQGVTALEGKDQYPEAYAQYIVRNPDYNFETGECMNDFAKRVADGMDWMAKQHAGETIAAVSHGGVLDILYRQTTGRSLAAGRDFDIPNCALNWFAHDGQRWHLEAWADRKHLQDALVETPE